MKKFTLHPLLSLFRLHIKSGIFFTLTVLSLTSLLLFISVPVIAEENDSDSVSNKDTEISSQDLSDSDSDETDSDTKKEEEKSEKSESQEMDMMRSATSEEPELEIEDQGFAFTTPPIEMFTGAANSTYPIKVPPGRNGMNPDLKLIYNSYRQNGIMGVGWKIDVGSIRRSTKNGVNYPANDFVFEKNGYADLVRRPDWDKDGYYYYGAKIEGEFTKYKLLSINNGWEVTTRDGTKYYYGTGSNSKQENAHGVFRWCLDEVVDTNGNYMTFTYEESQGEIYINRIDYAGNYNTGFQGTKHIDFIYESRTDQIPRYKTKAEVTTAQRLDRIKTYALGSLVRDYDFDYEDHDDGDSIIRSRLTEIKVYGSDSTLPPSRFEWQDVSSNFINGSTTLPISTDTEPAFFSGEVNGDGMSDVIVYYNNITRTYLSNGNGTFTFYSQSNVTLIPGGHNIRSGDVNRDGLTDFVIFHYISDPYLGVYFDGQITTFLADGNGSFTSMSTTLPIGMATDAVCYLGEVDGDGMSDILVSYSNITRTYLSNGDGTYTFNNQANVSLNPAGFSMASADFNGDGLTDFIKIAYNIYGNYEFRVESLLADGNGNFVSMGLTTLGTAYGVTELAYYSGEVNGDGMSDLIIYYNNIARTYLSHGDGTFTFHSQASISLFPGYKIRSADYNGDGLTDFIKIEYQQPYIYELDIESFLTDGDPSDLLTKIEHGAEIGGQIEGATINISYKPSTQYDNTYLPFNLDTASSITVDDGLGNQSITDYDYSGGLYDPASREFRGFDKVIKTRPDRETTEESRFHQDEFKKGRKYQVELKTLSQGDPIIITTLTWYTYPSSPVTWAFVKLTQKNTDFYNNPMVWTQENYTYDNGHGSLKTLMTSGTDAAETVTTTTMYDNYGDWVWRLYHESINGNTTGLVRQIDYTNELSTGNMLSKELHLDTGPHPIISMTYDSYGNKISETDARGNTTTYTYESITHSFPHLITYPETNGVTHIVENEEYDYGFGKVTITKDENGNRTYYDYDPFGRLEQTDYPDQGQIKTEYHDDVFPFYVLTKVKENAGSTIDKYEYFDGLRRTIQTITFGEDNKSIVTKTFYDKMGRVKRVEGPFFSTGLGYPKSPPAFYPWTETIYDYQSRPDEIKSANGDYGAYGFISTFFDYSGFSTTITDPDGKQKTEKRDNLGRIIRVTEHAEEGLLYTTYTYNAAGDLKTVTDYYGNITIITYDTLGRKINMNDPDMGYWEYEYDKNDNLIEQFDQKGQTINFSYDELNRITSKTYTTSDPTATYIYDNLSIPNGRGRLYSISNGNVTTTYNEYDPMGRVESVTKTITGASAKTTSNLYDDSGKVTRITYPDGYYVDQTYYPGTGLLYEVIGSDGKIYAECSLYEPNGKMGRVKHGNGVWTDYTYDPESTRLEIILTYKGVENISWYEYQYSRAGDIIEKQDNIRNITHTYNYDNLHRLTGETLSGSLPPVSSGGKILEFTYNDNDQPHAVKQITLNGNNYTYIYDDNGNMTNGPDFSNILQVTSRNIQYNADNMPKQINHSQNGTTSFTYDGENVRAKKEVAGGSTTYYVNQAYEIINGVGTKYIFAGNLRVAKVEGSTLHYFHKDHLGSSTVITDASGNNNAEETEYKPFGEMRWHFGSTVSNYKFTDQELDPSTGLYNYDARLYDPVIGRFISADSIIPRPFDPQSLNRYTYCRNNPLIYVDPKGKFEEFPYPECIQHSFTPQEIMEGYNHAIDFLFNTNAGKSVVAFHLGLITAGSGMLLGGGWAGSFIALSGSFSAAISLGNIINESVIGIESDLSTSGLIGGTISAFTDDGRAIMIAEIIDIIGGMVVGKLAIRGADYKAMFDSSKNVKFLLITKTGKIWGEFKAVETSVYDSAGRLSDFSSWGSIGNYFSQIGKGISKVFGAVWDAITGGGSRETTLEEDDLADYLS